MCGPSGNGTTTAKRLPEERLTDALKAELGVKVNPQALRIFIRTHWILVSKAAHEIHDAG